MKVMEADLPHDDIGATVMCAENLRGQRYAEIFLIGGSPIIHDLRAGVYNTIGLNDPNGTGNSCPQALLDKVDVAALKDRYGVLGAFKNGPRLWCLDWAEVTVGKERDFMGLKTRWVMWLDVPEEFRRHKSIAYKTITGNRHTRLGINEGSPAFVLDDPDGDSWVMKSAGLMVDPEQTYDSLEHLGGRLRPPPGWNFRAAPLERDLVLTPNHGEVKVTQDELGNTYDRVGDAHSNYKP